MLITGSYLWENTLLKASNFMQTWVIELLWAKADIILSHIFCMLVQIHASWNDDESLGVGVVKNACGQLCDGTLKSTLSEEWTNGINWFLACWCRFITVTSWSKIYWMGMVKNGCEQSGHGTLKLTVSQNVTDEITWFFCMQVQMQEGWKLIQSFLSVPCQRWQWLFNSWDPKTCILKMNIWIELIILMLIVMQ